MRLLNRVWTGIVAAIAGVAFALVAQIIGIMLVGLPIEYLGWFALVFGTIGFRARLAIMFRACRSRLPKPAPAGAAPWPSFPKNDAIHYGVRRPVLD